MLPAPHTPTNDPPQRRLPNFLLSASPTPSRSPFQSTPPPLPPPQQRQEITFNARLREDQPSIRTPPPPKPETRTSSRKPPNKSLLDVGPPSIHSIRSPTASPAPAPTPIQADTERWITVFGFPPPLESQVLREFRRHGEIMRTIPGKGNWVHILYRTPMQAQVSLHKPWTLLAGTDVMVGAAPCTEPHIAKENDQVAERGFLIASPSAASPYGPATPAPATPSTLPPTPGLRTPASVLRRDQGTTATPQSIVRTPQRQPGLLDYFTALYK